MAYYVGLPGEDESDEIGGNGGRAVPAGALKLKFANCNRPIFKELLHRAFQNAKEQCDRWGDLNASAPLLTKKRADLL